MTVPERPAHIRHEVVNHACGFRSHDDDVKLALIAVCALVLAAGAQASDGEMALIAPAEDVSLPFWCDWGYDWDERCYREDGVRLGVGGELDKVWRSALRFSTAAIPPGTTVRTAELSLWYDGTCLAPRKTSRPCDGRGYAFGAHPIFTPRWYAEREVEIGPIASTAALVPFASPQWLVWDVTDLVAEWVSGETPNNGVLLKLVDGQEDFDTSGPLFPSSTYPSASLRPRLTVWFQRTERLRLRLELLVVA
jgi:hypothetical protein